MKLFSYVIARDYGFAPNPFFGMCTLATCKPRIRAVAQRGDWVVGTGSQQRQRRGYLVYAMKVAHANTFDEYWKGSAYRSKRPNLHASRKQAYGDNIYYRNDVGVWQQRDSHHSHADGTLNQRNVIRDTQADRVLISKRYAYFGGSGPQIPTRFRDYDGYDVCAHRGHKCRFPRTLVEDFVAWFEGLGVQGFLGRPLDWKSE